MPRGFWAHGATLTVDGVDVDGLKSIGLPTQNKGEVDLTSHKSEGNAEFVGGLRDHGSVPFSGNLVPGDAGQDALRGNFMARNNVTFVIGLPEGMGTCTFQGYVSELGGDLPYDDAAEFTGSIRVSGEPVFEWAAS